MSAAERPQQILVVDDEPFVITLLKETLEREHYEVVSCTSPLKALAILETQSFGVIISDQRMPEMTGLDFLIESRRLCPEASRILLTAAVSLSTVVDAINKGELFRFVAKPWLREELLATVRNAFQRHELLRRNDELLAQTQQLNAQLIAANAELGTQIQTLQQRTASLDLANQELVTRNENSLELCRRILTAYDPILGGQAKALVEFANKMTENGPFTDAEAHALRSAAWLCDLGLIGVSRELLRTFRTTPNALTERERAALHNHPVYSQTLAALIDPRPEVGAVIRAHHEHFNGAGYPDRLSGNEIPWPARCLAVAVGFVESTAPKQTSIDQILARSGTHYDPEAVRLFMKVTHLVNLPRQVREILLSELEPGMVLASGIYSPHGLLLIGEGQALGPAAIAKIRDHNQIAPIAQRLLVYG
jgi:response regulator RpfG family c-di-GMP phosphodiesterase